MTSRTIYHRNVSPLVHFTCVLQDRGSALNKYVLLPAGSPMGPCIPGLRVPVGVRELESQQMQTCATTAATPK